MVHVATQVVVRPVPSDRERLLLADFHPDGKDCIPCVINLLLTDCCMTLSVDRNVRHVSVHDAFGSVLYGGHADLRAHGDLHQGAS